MVQEGGGFFGGACPFGPERFLNQENVDTVFCQESQAEVQFCIGQTRCIVGGEAEGGGKFGGFDSFSVDIRELRYFCAAFPDGKPTGDDCTTSISSSEEPELNLLEPSPLALGIRVSVLDDPETDTLPSAS